MSLEILEQIETSLVAKRQAVTEFIETASDTEKAARLCEDDHCVQDHLHVIETCLAKLDSHTLGICEICHQYVEPSQLAMNYTASICLDHYSEEEMRRLEDELELSQVVQRALLPQTVPTIDGVQVAAFSRPADIIGGDYFDFFHFRDGSHGLVIADVSGHGVAAGMLMSSLQTALRTMAPDTDSPAEILERINRFYIHNVNFTTFVTVFLARFDPHKLELTYVNAGHNPPAVHRRASNEIHWLKPTAPAIGLAEFFQPRIESVRLAKGDALLLYTDGVTEAVNAAGDEQFGQARLADLLSQNSNLAAPDILHSMYARASEFGNYRSLADDVTMVALKIEG
ncbi:MAG: SpoIIE family protein phosphatase [Anaerolineales bacterium]|nr:SpoIIE family protein phosphatase [Anaerolineales bacterium]